MMAHDASPSGVPAVACTDDADEVRALTDLIAGPPRFVLASAVCNDLALQRAIIAELSASRTDITTVEVRASSADPFTVANETTPACPMAVFVIGIGSWLGDPNIRRQRTASLNASRERWADRFGCPIVFWMNETTAQWLALHAPDLWRYRSHRFEFVGIPRVPDPSELTTMNPADAEWGGMSAEARRRRIDELMARVKANLSIENIEVKRLVAKWLHELANHHDFFDELDAEDEALILEGQIGEQLCDDSTIASAVGSLGRTQAMRGNLDVGESLLSRALTENRRLHRQMATGATLANLGNIARARGDADAADELFRDAAEEAERAGDLSGRANALNNFAVSALNKGNAAAAGPLLEQSLDLYRQVGRLDGESTVLSNLGALAFRRGDLDVAERLHEEGLARDRMTGRLKGEVNHLAALGFIGEARGEVGVAHKWWTEALNRVAPYGVPAWSTHFRRLIDRLPPTGDTAAPRCPAAESR